MEKTFISILPLALAASVNPTGVLAIVFILSLAKKPVRKAFAFLSGSFILLVALATLINLAISDVSRTTQLPPWLSAGFDIILGLLVLYLGFKAHFDQKRETHKKRHKFHGSFFLPGIIYMAIDFSSLVPFIAANKMIAAGKLNGWAVIVLVAFMIVLTLLWLIVPLAIRILFPAKSENMLSKLEAYFREHGPVLVEVMLFVIAVYLIIHGALKIK